MITFLLGALISGVVFGFPLWLQAARRSEAETTLDDQQVTIDDQADTAAEHLERIAELEGSVHTWQTLQAAEAELKRKAMEDRDWERMLRVIAEAEIERHRDTHTCLPGLDGIAAHGVSEPVGEVVDDEPTWVGLVREVAEVVPLKKRGAK